MRCKFSMLTLALALSAPLTAGVPALLVAPPATAQQLQPKEGWYKNLVDFDFVANALADGKKASMMLIDSRPAARQYDLGHIPGAVNIPDSQFDRLADRLPKDKQALLVFYCGGVDCPLSHNSAVKAEKLGYTNIKVYPAGMPDWKARGGPVNVPAKPATLEGGKETGTVTVDSLLKVWKENPDSIVLVDVREPKEFEGGTIKGARSIPIGDLEKKLGGLPTNKPVVFFCLTAARAGEAYDTARMLRSEVQAVFLESEISLNPDGSFRARN